jgi:hypothetical protein
MINLVREICERKKGKIHPEIATEREIEQELTRRGIAWTKDSLKVMLAELAKDTRIRTCRTINHTAYAYITEATEESIPPKARDAGPTHTRKYALLSKSAVEKSEEDIPRVEPAMCGVLKEREDNASDNSGSHHSDKFWWTEI